MNKVVITGIGAVSPLGNNFKSSWNGIKQGLIGVSKITRFDASNLKWQVAGEIKNFNPLKFLTIKESRQLDLFIQYSVASAIMSLQDSRLQSQDYIESLGIIIGSSRGGICTIEREILKLCNCEQTPKISPYFMPLTTINMASAYTAKKIGASGVCFGVSNACASGLTAIGEAYRLIKDGYAQAILAGGSDAPICKTCILGYGVSGALSKSHLPTASKPFDVQRDGFVLSEGACVLVLENYEIAKQRGAKIYAEIKSYANETDAFHITQPLMEGQQRTMLKCLKTANVNQEEIDFISAHGTSTIIGDITEAIAIKEVFKNLNIKVTAIKSMTGHLLGASGAFELACCAASILEGFIPATLNVNKTDVEINLVRQNIEQEINTVLVNSFGFGGVNTIMILKKCK